MAEQNVHYEQATLMPSRPTLLCVANFPSGTGYAWDFFEKLFAGIARHIADRGVQTLVAYPELTEVGPSFQDNPARAIELPVRLTSPGHLARFVSFIRRHDVRALFFIDRGFWHPAYPLLRAAGVRRIVAYDESSGARGSGSGLKRALKAASRRIPGSLADSVLTVSDYVARRQIEVGLLPEDRVETVWNGVPIPERNSDRDIRQLRVELGVEPETFLVACTCRASEVKGVQHLFRAFDRLVRSHGGLSSSLSLVYVGDGPFMEQLRQLRSELPSRDRIVMTGYRDDAADIVGASDVAVVPSVWQEAFGIAALEPMTRARPVVASSVGGIPEIVRHEETGLLVPPGDEEALASALRRLLERPEEARRMGEAGRERARRHFDPDQQVSRLTEILGDAFDRSAAVTAGA